MKSISTSALAKKLGKSAKQMFSELEALGWIEREEEQWQLTAKGEFEQGSFRDSEKFGRYIVWPESIAEHRALVNPESRYTTAKGLGLKTGINASVINQLLADLGWIKPWLRGWQVTEHGRVMGGLQKEDARTAIPYVSWPKELTDNSVFKRARQQQSGIMAEVIRRSGCMAMDGHLLRSEAELKIDNWLYLAGVVHGCNKPLPVNEQACADFYLPSAQLFIEYWGCDTDPSYLAEKMKKKEIYQQHQLKLLELKEQDLVRLDEVLSRELRRFGIEC